MICSLIVLLDSYFDGSNRLIGFYIDDVNFYSTFTMATIYIGKAIPFNTTGFTRLHIFPCPVGSANISIRVGHSMLQIYCSLKVSCYLKIKLEIVVQIINGRDNCIASSFLIHPNYLNARLIGRYNRGDNHNNYTNSSSYSQKLISLFVCSFLLLCCFLFSCCSFSIFSSQLLLVERTKDNCFLCLTVHTSIITTVVCTATGANPEFIQFLRVKLGFVIYFQPILTC